MGQWLGEICDSRIGFIYEQHNQLRQQDGFCCGGLISQASVEDMLAGREFGSWGNWNSSRFVEMEASASLVKIRAHPWLDNGPVFTTRKNTTSNRVAIVALQNMEQEVTEGTENHEHGGSASLVCASSTTAQNVIRVFLPSSRRGSRQDHARILSTNRDPAFSRQALEPVHLWLLFRRTHHVLKRCRRR